MAGCGPARRPNRGRGLRQRRGESPRSGTAPAAPAAVFEILAMLYRVWPPSLATAAYSNTAGPIEETQRALVLCRAKLGRAGRILHPAASPHRVLACGVDLNLNYEPSPPHPPLYHSSHACVSCYEPSPTPASLARST